MNMLIVKSVNLHWGSNSRAHRTDKFEICRDCDDPTPVLRRGQTFNLSINFDRPYDHVTDVVRVYFKCLDVEKKSHGIRNYANITVNRGSRISREKDVWSVALLSEEGNSIHLKMRSPVTIPFATYELNIDTKHKLQASMKKYVHHKNVYFLFNPWEKEDKVHMPQTDLLDEYILNDVGKIYISSDKKPQGQPWVFGQFAKPILPALILALNESNLDYEKRGNAVRLTRELTRLLNAQTTDYDDEPEGVLMGRSSEYNHADCTNPILWNDSISIFEEYLNSNGKPVKYGECWIFSAITTTACRAIGIPCRSVTNFSSAQDTNKNMTVENYIIPSDKPELEEDYKNENIWDFHSWNDVWMTRYDMPQGYGGWQAIDSTPVRQMGGVHQCGPASLVAIKRGEINNRYNVEYFTSAVNADVVNFVYSEEEEDFKPISIDHTKIGRLILTKRPHVYDPNGNNDYEDITEQYKEKEGSKEERLAFFNALKQSDYNWSVYDIDKHVLPPAQFLHKPIDSMDIGEDMVIPIRVMNGSEEVKTGILNVSISSLYYNGNKGKSIRKLTEKVKVAPRKEELVEVRIPAVEYAPKLIELGFVKVSTIGRILENNYCSAFEYHFIVNLPEVVIKTKETLKKNKEGILQFTIRNPLKTKLTGCKFIFEAYGIGKNVLVPCREVMAEEEVSVETKVVPEKSGEFFITAQFDSAQLKCVIGKSSLIVY